MYQEGFVPDAGTSRISDALEIVPPRREVGVVLVLRESLEMIE